jgi:cell wall-associated NlpC family hydrolase
MPYIATTNLNIYDSVELKSLATQAAAGRYLEILAQSNTPATTLSTPTATATPPSLHPSTPLPIRLCADGYPGWLAPDDVVHLEPSLIAPPPATITEPEIRRCIPQIIAFTSAAMAVPNEYLWGGTVAPNYDCSGLMQAAFISAGIQLPRDAYQQEAFVEPIALADCILGDLIFFGTPVKATHVALYLGDDRYIHSSGKDQGRNGIGIDELSPTGDAVSRAYYAQLRGAGRVIASYQPA